MKLTDDKIKEIARSMPSQPWGIGSTSKDAINFARAILKEAGVEELERDAERYRWLRDGGVTHSATLFVSDDEGYDLCDSALDASIDEAIKAK